MCREWIETRTGRAYRKSTLPKSSWTESGKLETAAGTYLKRRKEKGEGLNSIKTVNSRSAESATPQLDTWRCSGGKGKSPGPEWGLGGSWATQGEAVPLLEGHLVDVVRTFGPRRPQRMATVAGAGTRSLGVKPGARCVL